MIDYSKLTSEEFSDILEELIHEMSVQEILSYGEVNVFFREELNNVILDRWELRQGINN